MALPFFYHPGLNETSVVLQPDEATGKHIVQVLRMKEGEQLHLTNGKGLLAVCDVREASKKSCSLNVIGLNKTERLVTRKVAISVSPVKNTSRFEWFLEKATELGVTEIFPTICTRTEREYFRYERMNAICISAMLQSQQAWLPVLHPPLSFNDVINQSSYANKWIAHCTEGQKTELAQSLKKDMTDSLVLIGPEGDFTREEIASAITAGYQPVALGATRLRTETAALVAATVLLMY